jgi:serine/threonine protein kinase
MSKVGKIVKSEDLKSIITFNLYYLIDINNIIGNYRLEKTIGEGTFGKVKLGLHLPTEEQVAIKILEKDKIQDKEDLDRITREINFLKKLKHQNIIKIYEVKKKYKFRLLKIVKTFT